MLLGFRGVVDFAAQAGIGHGTATSLLYNPKHGHRFASVIRVYSALHAAYHEVPATAAQRALIKDFTRRWVAMAMERVVFEVPLAWKDVSPRERRARLRRERRVRAAAWTAIKSLKWE